MPVTAKEKVYTYMYIYLPAGDNVSFTAILLHVDIDNPTLMLSQCAHQTGGREGGREGAKGKREEGREGGKEMREGGREGREG